MLPAVHLATLMQTGIQPDYKTLYEQAQSLNQTLQLRVIQLQQQLSQLQKMIFGSKQERFVVTDAGIQQLSLAIEAESVAACSIASAQKISYTRTNTTVEPKPLVHPGRMKLPESLRREEIIIEPSEATEGCKKMGEEITEVLDYTPGELFVKKYIRPKYAKQDNAGILIGSLPSRPLQKAMAGEGCWRRSSLTNMLIIVCYE